MKEFADRPLTDREPSFTGDADSVALRRVPPRYGQTSLRTALVSARSWPLAFAGVILVAHEGTVRVDSVGPDTSSADSISGCIGRLGDMTGSSRSSGAGTMRMRATALVSLALALMVGTGCRTWREVPMASVSSRPLAKQSRVVRTDGVWIEMSRARLTTDSITGTTRDGRIAVPRDSIRRLEEQRVNWRRSTGLFLTVYLGMAFVISGPEVFGL